jgi:hypothetical protein
LTIPPPPVEGPSAFGCVASHRSTPGPRTPLWPGDAAMERIPLLSPPHRQERVAEGRVRWTSRITGLNEGLPPRAPRCAAAPIAPESPTDPERDRAEPTLPRGGVGCHGRGGVGLGHGARSAPMDPTHPEGLSHPVEGIGESTTCPPIASTLITPPERKPISLYLDFFPFSSMVYSG